MIFSLFLTLLLVYLFTFFAPLGFVLFLKLVNSISFYSTLLLLVSSLFLTSFLGYLFTYFAPLGFVLFVTISKEAYDDFKRYRRDNEANAQMYEQLTPSGVVQIPSSQIKVGDLIIVHKNQRVPADMILVRTTEKSGACFIRTDQLDGETDCKRYSLLGTRNKFHKLIIDREIEASRSHMSASSVR